MLVFGEGFAVLMPGIDTGGVDVQVRMGVQMGMAMHDAFDQGAVLEM
jgi:hypothetical protein